MSKRAAQLIDEADQLAEDDPDAALKALERVFAMKLAKPVHVQALMCRASIYDDLEDHDRAIADCNAALALDPRSPDVYYLRSTIYQSAENWTASRADLDAAIAIEPQPDLFESRGLARYNLGDYAGARADFATAIAANPDIEPRFHIYRGMAALLANDPAASIDDFTNALAADSENVKALAQRAKAYEACGKPAAALADLDRINALIPPSPMLDAERARVRSKLGHDALTLAARRAKSTPATRVKSAAKPTSTKSTPARAKPTRKSPVKKPRKKPRKPSRDARRPRK